MSRKKLILVALVLLVAIGGGGAGGYFVYSQQREKKVVQNFFSDVSSLNQVEADITNIQSSTNQIEKIGSSEDQTTQLQTFEIPNVATAKDEIQKLIDQLNSAEAPDDLKDDVAALTKKLQKLQQDFSELDAVTAYLNNFSKVFLDFSKSIEASTPQIDANADAVEVLAAYDKVIGEFDEQYSILLNQLQALTVPPKAQEFHSLVVLDFGKFYTALTQNLKDMRGILQTLANLQNGVENYTPEQIEQLQKDVQTLEQMANNPQSLNFEPEFMKYDVNKMFSENFLTNLDSTFEETITLINKLQDYQVQNS